MPNIIEEKIQEFEEQKFFTFLEDAEWEESAKYFLRQALTEVATAQREADKAVLEGMKRRKPSVLTSQGFTKPTCKDCGAKFSWHNGNPSALCKDCKLPIEIDASNAALDQAISKLV